MAKVIEARAFCNNEVAYLAWKTDGKIEDCLGFMITRINLDTGERRLLPAWVAFDTQSNPDWEAQDTSVWPIQKFSWRDLTLRRSRNTLQVRAPFQRQIRDRSGRPGSAGPGGGAALTDRATRQIQGQSDSDVRLRRGRRDQRIRA